MVKIEKVEMTEEELKETKIQLEYSKLQKDETDLQLAELEETLDKKVAVKLLDDDIAKLSGDIEKKIILDNYGNEVDATEADLIRMNITLNKFKKQKELDIPGRQLRLKIHQLRDAKERIDAPERQIKKLEKQVREKAYERTVTEDTNPMTD